MRTRLLSIVRRTKVAILSGAAVTYPICVAFTWQQSSSLLWKLFINATADLLSAVLWPATWLTWIVLRSAGYVTPLHTVLGL
ncbi:hypothetical protein PY365_03090 [Roseiarcaceae bacterium H3SJ34-1]|uniref:hypothetical protein n=1 Tax=Terripilifer ovatus TaxID=3032367 RepID=UPI003AB9AED3|nr:hypothetical protein [Roseiarcaceae bacterium H3SJ34-1]